MSFGYAVVGIALAILIIGLIRDKISSQLEQIAIGLAIVVAWPLVLVGTVVLGLVLLCHMVMVYIQDKFDD